jgi:hypothetical protein
MEDAIFIQLDQETVFDNKSRLPLKLVPEPEPKLV